MTTTDQRREAAARRAAALDAIATPTDPGKDLSFFDLVVVNVSGGKDSHALLDVMVRLATAHGVRERLMVVHADLGAAEWDASVALAPGWAGTTDLVRRQCAAYGLTLQVARRTVNGKVQPLVEQIDARGLFPSSSARYCTSDQKRDPIAKLVRAEAQQRGTGLGRPVRVLNVMGMRAAESPVRAGFPRFALDRRATAPTSRHVWEWLPILRWPTERVWKVIAASPAPAHPIYDHGLSRASCSFCILAAQGDLILSAMLRPWLAYRYLEMERRHNHRFRNDLSMAEILTRAAPRCAGQWTLAA